MLSSKRILLIITGGIAAYKSLDLIRKLRAAGAAVTPVLTGSAKEFVTPLSVAALAGEKVHSELFDLTSEAEMGHIELSRSADLILVAPATADMMAKMAQGRADDLASTLILATDTPVLIAPSMNVRMWGHSATQRNLRQLQADGVKIIGPDAGDMACGEFGPGRMSEPVDILTAVQMHFTRGPLTGQRVLVTSGPTHEPIDPVRYIANRSSGRQGSAIAQALVSQGAEVVFISGPAAADPPLGAQIERVETALEMAQAVEQALPCNIAIFVAAVADYRVDMPGEEKIKKQVEGLSTLSFVENPDILASVAQHRDNRPDLVIGFAAETEALEKNAQAKRMRKGCDWLLANDVSAKTGIMGGDENAILCIEQAGVDQWPRASKAQVAERLVQKIIDHVEKASTAHG